jgi:hypothetical protein
LRSDVLRIAKLVRAFTLSFEGKSLTRLRLLEHPAPELAAIANKLNAQQLAELSALIEAAVARGEISRDTDVLLLLDMLWGVVYARLEMRNESVSDAVLERIVDVLVDAARFAKKPQRKLAKRKRKA